MRTSSTTGLPYFTMSNLSYGVYFIRNRDIPANRNLAEDRSLLPKRVYCPSDHEDAEMVSALNHIDGPAHS